MTATDHLADMMVEKCLPIDTPLSNPSEPQSDVASTPSKKQTDLVRDFWLSSTVEQEKKFDDKTGDCCLKITTKWYWLSNEEVEIANNENRLFIKHELNIGNFPVNPKLPFLNSIDLQEITALSDAKCSDNTDDETRLDFKYVVYAQKHYRTTIRTRTNVKRYPFDRHIIPAILGTGKHKLEDGRKVVWTLLTNKPKWCKSTYEEDTHVISHQKQWVDPNDELEQDSPRLLYSGKKPALCMTLQRNPTFFYRILALPNFIIVMVSMVPLFLDIRNAWDRVEALASGLLQVIAYQITLAEKLPCKTYTTYANLYILFTYAFLLLIAIKVVFVNYMVGEETAGFFQFESSATQDSTAEPEPVAKYTVLLDDITTWLLVCLWVPLHFLFAVDMFDPHVLRNYLYTPWEDIFIPEDNVVHCKDSKSGSDEKIRALS